MGSRANGNNCYDEPQPIVLLPKINILIHYKGSVKMDPGNSLVSSSASHSGDTESDASRAQFGNPVFDESELHGLEKSMSSSSSSMSSLLLDNASQEGGNSAVESIGLKSALKPSGIVTTGLPTGLSPSSSGSSGHRSRKEKLICRSDADSIVVQTAATLGAESPNSLIDSKDTSVNLADGSPVKEGKVKKQFSPNKASRPYNRKKSSSEVSFKEQTFSQSNSFGNENETLSIGGMEVKPAKRPYKRRAPVQSKEKGVGEIERKLLSPKRRISGPNTETGNKTSPKKSPVKTKPITPAPRVTKYGRALSDWEASLLPFIASNKIPTTSTTNLKSPGPAVAGPSSALLDKPLSTSDLRLFGPPSSLPIFKPKQKPWKVLRRLLEGKDSEEKPSSTGRKDTARKDSLNAGDPYGGQSISSWCRNLETLDEFGNPVQIEGVISSDDDSSSDDWYCEPDLLNDPSIPKVDARSKLRVIPIPVELKDGKCVLPSDETLKTIIDRLKEIEEQRKKQETERKLFTTRRRMSSQGSESLDPSQEKFVSENWALPKERDLDNSDSIKYANRKGPFSNHYETPATVTSDSVLTTSTNSVATVSEGRPNMQNDTFSSGFTRNHRYSGSDSYQFTPIPKETPQSPLGGAGFSSSRWSFGQNGRESPGNGFGTYNSFSFGRFQPPSPSPSSVSGSSNSGRRYSRRRHSRMYPPFETSHCMYSKHFCPAPLEPCSTYCKKHVSEKSSPYYVRCAFFNAKTGIRCSNMQYSRDGKQKFCSMHASRLALVRQKLCRKPRPKKSTPDHLMEMRRVMSKLKKTKRTEVVEYLENYCDYKLQTQCMENEVESADLTDGPSTVEAFCKFQVDRDSDGECDVGDEYDCLRKAGYYSTEEVVRILISKLKKLKGLYTKEFDFLKLYYLIKRQEYLLAEEKLKQKKVSRNPKALLRMRHLVSDEFIESEFKTAKKTRALLNYHKNKGQSAVLHHLAKKRYEDIKRTEADSPMDVDGSGDDDGLLMDGNPIVNDYLNTSKSSKSSGVHPVCCKYSSEMSRCESTCLPACEFCVDHMGADPYQVLFQPCNYPLTGNRFCTNNVLKKLDKSGCDFHCIYRLKRFRKSKAEKKERQTLWRSLPPASVEETTKMLETLVASRFSSLEEFDKEIDSILGKGLDRFDTSDSDIDDCEYEEVDDAPATGEKLRVRESRKEKTFRDSKSFMQGPKRPVGRPPKILSREAGSQEVLTPIEISPSLELNGLEVLEPFPLISPSCIPLNGPSPSSLNDTFLPPPATEARMIEVAAEPLNNAETMDITQNASSSALEESGAGRDKCDEPFAGSQA